jgi:hypothetical protein
MRGSRYWGGGDAPATVRVFDVTEPIVTLTWSPTSVTYTYNFTSGGFNLYETTEPETFDNAATCYDNTNQGKNRASSRSMKDERCSR